MQTTPLARHKVLQLHNVMDLRFAGTVKLGCDCTTRQVCKWLTSCLCDQRWSCQYNFEELAVFGRLEMHCSLLLLKTDCYTKL